MARAGTPRRAGRPETRAHARSVGQPHEMSRPLKRSTHAIGLRRLGLGQPELNPQRLVQRIELVRPCGRAAATAKQPVCELFAVVRGDGVHPEQRSLAHRCQEGSVWCCLMEVKTQ